MPQLIMFIAPAIVAALLYNKINHLPLTLFRFIIVILGFAVVINGLTFLTIWLWGYTGIEWLSDGAILRPSFYLKYMGISIIFAFALTFMITGLKQTITGRNTAIYRIFAIVPIILLILFIGMLVLLKFELISLPGLVSKQEPGNYQEMSDAPESIISEMLVLVEKQAQIDDSLLAELNGGEHSFDDPLVIVDPYNISPLTALVLFTSDEPMNISVHISGKTKLAEIDFTFDGFNTEHFIPIYGLYPNESNNVEITARTINGDAYKKTLEIRTEPLPPELAMNIISVDLKQNDKYQPGMNFTYTQKTAFDVNGDYRWFLNDFKLNRQTLFNYNGNMIISQGSTFEGDILFYIINPLGKIFNVYYSPYGAHHDIIAIDDKNLIISGSRGETTQDFLYEIDAQSGEIVNTFDLKTILQQTRSNAAPLYDNEDWFHHNATVYREGKVIISGRDQAAVVKMSWPEGEIDWILSNHEGWEPIFHDFLLTPIGVDFEWPYSQHAPEILPDYDNDPDTIDILLFDNGFGRLTDSETITPGCYSRMVHYRINEKTKTIEQLWEFGKVLGEDYFAFLAGDADLLENGNLLGTFDRRNPLDTVINASFLEVNRNGDILWEAYATSNDSAGAFSTYRLERLPLYTFTANDLQIGVHPRNIVPEWKIQ